MFKAEVLTNEHFKNRNLQRFYKYFFDNSDMWISFIWALPVCLFILGSYFDNDYFGAAAFFCIFWFPAGTFVCGVFSAITWEVFRNIASFFYRAPSQKIMKSIWDDGLILIDPDGNPKMTYRISKYPALRYYRYRLPDAGDLDKITEYLENYSYPKDNYDRYRLSE